MLFIQVINSVFSLFADDMILYIENPIKQPNQKVREKKKKKKNKTYLYKENKQMAKK